MTVDDSNDQDISPKYIINLASQVEERLWSTFENSRYQKVKHYILRWHNSWYNGFDHDENFHIYYQDENQQRIDLSETLLRMPSQILIKVAIDLDVDTPAFLPSIPTFKNVLKDENENSFQSFSRAIKNVFENPDEAIALANTTLESIVKTILSDGNFPDIPYKESDTLYELTQKVLKAFKAFPGKEVELQEIAQIGSGLLNISKNIESLRSTKTKAHGKSKSEHIIDDPLWAQFVVNAVASVGLLLESYYRARFVLKNDEESKAEPEKIVLSDIPF